MTRMVAAAALVAASIFTAPLLASPAYAATAQPPTDWSFYVEVGDNSTGASKMDTLGCNQAHFDTSVASSSLVILDFGALNIAGSGDQLTINGIENTPTAIETLAEWFINGYKGCSPTQSVTLAVGTNNSITLGAPKGTAFADTVMSIARFASSNANGHVGVWGANDIETFYDPTTGSYATPAQTYGSYQGYSGQGGPLYVDYGSADGCPLNLSGPCSYGWTQGTYYNLSWGYSLALAAPEIYVYPQAQQWHYISQFGSGTSSGPMSPEGPLDEYDLNSSTYTSGQAWNELSTYFPSMPYSLEMHAAL